MENPYNTETENKEDQLSDKEIFTRIWIDPVRIFRYINKKEYDKYIPLIIISEGFINLLEKELLRKIVAGTSLGVTMITYLFLGALFGWIAYYIKSKVLHWTGSWLGGKANLKQILRVVAYATIPAFVAQFLGCLMPHSYPVLLVRIVFYLYGLTFIIFGLAEVQKFTIGKSILNIIITIVIFAITIYVTVHFIFNFI